jgi:hypothetical protein
MTSPAFDVQIPATENEIAEAIRNMADTIRRVALDRDRLQAVINRLPKCWRLNESGELVQDVPMVPGLRVWIKFGGKITETTHDGTDILKSFWSNAAMCYSSLEAAEASWPRSKR